VNSLGHQVGEKREKKDKQRTNGVGDTLARLARRFPVLVRRNQRKKERNRGQAPLPPL